MLCILFFSHFFIMRIVWKTTNKRQQTNKVNKKATIQESTVANGGKGKGLVFLQLYLALFMFRNTQRGLRGKGRWVSGIFFFVFLSFCTASVKLKESRKEWGDGHTWIENMNCMNRDWNRFRCSTARSFSIGVASIDFLQWGSKERWTLNARARR